MKKFLLLILFFVTFSCMKSEITQHWYENKSDRRLPNGLQLYFSKGNQVTGVGCGPGWGSKGCAFLYKHNPLTDAFTYIKQISPLAQYVSHNFLHFGTMRICIIFLFLDIVICARRGLK